MSVFGKGESNGSIPPTSIKIPVQKSRTGKLSENAKILLQIAEWTEIEKFMILGPHLRLQLVKHSLEGLLDSIDEVPSKPSPTYEQYQAFALELATRSLLTSNEERAKELFPIFQPKFHSLALKLTKSKKPIPVPFLVERMVVTILRSIIHLYKIPEMRQQLQTSLSYVSALPNAFLAHIADRMACGMAIIWRSSFNLFNSPKDLKLIEDSFNKLADFPLGRGLIFDGIASTIEFTIPDDSSFANILEYEERVRETESLSVPASVTIARVLLNYIHGTSETDSPLVVPAMVCVKKVYNHVVQLTLINKKNDPNRNPNEELPSVPDLDIWYSVSVAYYEVCINPDEDISNKGLEACQKHVLVSDLTEIPDSKWTNFINIMIKKQPPLSCSMPRVNSLSMIAQLMIKLFPIMTQRESNWKALTEITKKVVEISHENMKRRRSPDVLFDLTSTIVSHLSDQLASPKFGGERRYCKWSSELFSKVLLKNGATGTKKSRDNSDTKDSGGDII